MAPRSRNTPPPRLGAALIALAVVTGGTTAHADCPPHYEREQRAELDAHYTREALDIAVWRDHQFRFALDQYNATIRNGSKPIYARLETDRQNLRDRIVSGDLRQAGQAERSEAARRIGAEFRRELMELRVRAKQDYHAQIALTRADVADMRRTAQHLYAVDRKELRKALANGCRQELSFSLRSIFIWTGNLIAAPGPAPEPVDIPFGTLGIRG